MYTNFVLNNPERYYQYYELTNNGPLVISAEEIIKKYYEEWSNKMIIRHGIDNFKNNYGYEDCIYDFCSLNLAFQIY